MAANRTGALFATVGGTIIYCATQALGFKLFGLHQITIGITCSLAFFVLGSLLGKPEDESVLEIFFPGRKKESAEAVRLAENDG